MRDKLSLEHSKAGISGACTLQNKPFTFLMWKMLKNAQGADNKRQYFLCRNYYYISSEIPVQI